jgi:hypothetical protein
VQSKEEADKKPEDYIYFLTRLKARYIRGQYLVLPLAMLYTHKSPDNPYYKSKKLMTAIEKGMVFFDKHMEYEFHQHRICNYLAQAYGILEKQMNKKQKKLFTKIFEKWGPKIAARVKRATPHVGKYTAREIGVNTNHFAIYNLALLRMGKILGKKAWINMGTRHLKGILARQHPDGYWDEYNGPAISYNYVTLHTLHSYYQETSDKNVLPAIEKAVKFHMYFIYPDGSKIETPDGRTQMGYGPAIDCHAAFSHSPEGKWLAKKFLDQWLAKNPNPVAWGEVGCIFADNFLGWQEEAPRKPLPTARSKYTYRLKLPAGVRRAKPWLVSYSAIAFPKVWLENQFFLWRQMRLSVWHDSTGLILIGPNTRGHQQGGTFSMHRNFDQIVGILKSGTLTQKDGGDVLTGKYDGFGAKLVVKPVNDKAFQITGSIIPEYDPKALFTPDYEMHLFLNLQIGDTIETQGSGKIVLEDKYEDYVPKKVGKWIKKGRWQLFVPANTRLVWPYVLHNPYSLFGFPGSTRMGMVIMTFPSIEEKLTCRLLVGK